MVLIVTIASVSVSIKRSSSEYAIIITVSSISVSISISIIAMFSSIGMIIINHWYYYRTQPREIKTSLNYVATPLNQDLA